VRDQIISRIVADLIDPMALAVRSKFTREEDGTLRALVQTFGQGNWEAIASFVNGRNSRQCKERWIHYLDPNIIVKPWTKREDRLLEQKVAELGTKWKQLESLSRARPRPISRIDITCCSGEPHARFGLHWVCLPKGKGKRKKGMHCRVLRQMC
jgi:hypothetical protein